MIIDCISDLHGYYPKLEGGDLLIVAGDMNRREEWNAYLDLQRWLNEQDYKEIIFIAGNHDTLIQDSDVIDDLLYEHIYLKDSCTEFQGLKIWGTPWTSRFEGINPHCCAFTGEDDSEISPKFDLIPTDVDILITHSPPFTVRDETVDGRQVGSPSLTAHILSRLRPKLHVFGHIHEAYGIDTYQWTPTKFVNASHVNERYEPVNKPVRIEL